MDGAVVGGAGEGVLDDDALHDALRSAYAAAERAHAVAVAHLAEVQRRRSWEASGRRSLAVWLADLVPGMTRTQARVEVRLAALLEEADLVRGALGDGRLTCGHVRALADVRNARTALAFDRDERVLVGVGSTLSVDEFTTVVGQWRTMADTDGTAPDDPTHNRCTITPVGGRVRLAADLDAVTGAAVQEAVEACVGRLYRAEGDAERAATTPARRRANALAHLVGAGATVADDGRHVARPSLTVVCTADELAAAGRAPLVVTLPTGGWVRGATLRRLACDADVARVVLGPDSEVLDAGRSRRLPSRAQRRAVLARDRGCAVHGCGAPPWLCEIHHLRHWADGGPTDVDNLAMVCRWHHRQAHRSGWHLGRDPDGVLRCRPELAAA